MRTEDIARPEQASYKVYVEAGFELFDHTADMGLRIWAPDRVGLIPPATTALYAAIGEVDTCLPQEEALLIFGDCDPALLLRDYLAALLLRFERDRRVLTLAHGLQFEDSGLKVGGSWMRLDEQASSFHREVKAVTYHDLWLGEVPGGFEARLIVDI